MSNEVLWGILAGAVVGLLVKFFWKNTDSTTERIDKVEKTFEAKILHIEGRFNKLEVDVYAKLDDMQRTLNDIRHSLDVSSGLERPAKICRDYLVAETTASEKRILSGVELIIRRFLDRPNEVINNRQEISMKEVKK
jgi:hypothetical protein